MEKERRLSGSRIVNLVRRPCDRHPTGGLKLGRCIETFVFDIVKRSPAEHAGLLVGDLVEEVDGIPCKNFKLPDLEQMITEKMQEGLVTLKVKSDQRIFLREERRNSGKNSQQVPPLTNKGRKVPRSRRNLFPSVHPNQMNSDLCDSTNAAIATPHRKTNVRKFNMDKEAEPEEIERPCCKNAATNTECVLSYFVSARAFREWLGTQRKTDCREPGSFAKNVRIYNSMVTKEGKGKKSKKGKLEAEPESPKPPAEESSNTSPANRKKVLGSALSSVGRLLHSRREPRLIPK